jgi:hypothetical protein
MNPFLPGVCAVEHTPRVAGWSAMPAHAVPMFDLAFELLLGRGEDRRIPGIGIPGID